MAQVVKEEQAIEQARQLRRTLVQARDGKHFRVLTFRIYDEEPRPEFHRFETSVSECDENGKFRVLIQPLIKRFFREDEARTFHDEVLKDFDALLKIPEPKPKPEPKPPAPPPPPA
ncbi:MAG: hypothetical protein ACYTAF_08880, partial [Planctomycetota bacterium]